MEICDFCEVGELELVDADPPRTLAHFQCPVCDSTYNVEYDLEVEFELEMPS